MKYNPDLHKRHTIRLKKYDYSQEGMYFITICTKNRENILGKVIESKNILSKLGTIAEEGLLKTQKINRNVKIYDYVIMPNHIHVIINIEYRAQSCAPTTIGTIIRGIKSAISSKIGHSIWQRNYYEHIIRNEKELYRIQEYIKYNPNNWENDENNLQM